MAEAYGIEERPSLVVFEKGIPNVYEGDLYDSDIGNTQTYKIPLFCVMYKRKLLLSLLEERK